MINKLLIFITLPGLLLAYPSCNPKEKGKNSLPKDTISISDSSRISYATFFDIRQKDGYKILEVKSPEGSGKTIKRYYLAKDGMHPPKGLDKKEITWVPLKNVVITASTQVAYLERINTLKHISGISEIQYFKNQAIKKLYKKGAIKDVGAATNLNNEILLNIDPGIIFISLFHHKNNRKIDELGIKTCIDAAYLENTPLGRAEWIKFFAAFFSQDKLADSVFDAIKTKYLSIKERTRNLEYKPTIISGKKYGQTWHVPGGKSYMAKYYADAGADYLWTNTEQTGSIALDFETVYAKGADADYWCFKEAANRFSYTSLVYEFEPYSNFKAFKKKSIIVCDVSTKPYYETGVMQPDVILADLVNLIHPGILKNHKNKYFEFLEDE